MLFFSSPLPLLSRVMRFPSQLRAAREGCEEEEKEAALSNEPLPSQPPLPPPLLLLATVTTDQLTSGPHAADAERRSSCWTRGHAGAPGCYCDVRGAFKRPSPRGASLDDWLRSLTAWHNRLPSRRHAVEVLPSLARLGPRPSLSSRLCCTSRPQTRALSLSPPPPVQGPDS